MTHPELLCANLAAALTAGRSAPTTPWAFYYGKPPDQNFEADEMAYPALFLDKPIVADVNNTKSNLRLLRIKLGLFFAYKAEIDATEPDKFQNCKTLAWAAAREFVLRLRQANDDVKDVVEERLTDVDHVFDINLCGCLAEITIDLIDAGPVCLT